jgi:predicted DNA-binding protein YlxM (UPF0122 family)
MTEKVYNFYKDKMNKFTTILDLIYVNKLSKVDACRQCKTSVYEFDSFLTNLSPSKVTGNTLYPNWKDKFLHTIFGDEIVDCKEFDEAYAYCLSQLTERECKVIRLRFEENYSLRDIGKEFGVTAERVRQIYNVAIRKLKRPRLSKVLRYGMEYVTLNNKVGELELLKKQNESNKTILWANRFKYVNSYDDFSNIKLSDLNLSTRCRNSLQQAKIYNLKDIIDKSYLIRNGSISGFGTTSLKELMSELQGSGIDLTPNRNSSYKM